MTNAHKYDRPEKIQIQIFSLDFASHYGREIDEDFMSHKAEVKIIRRKKRILISDFSRTRNVVVVKS